MYNPMEAEARIEKLAKEGIDVASEQGIELTEAIEKVAESHGLNDDEVANVCARANHLTWNNVRNENMLGTFKIAKYEDINDKVKTVTETKEYVPYMNPNSLQKVASDDQCPRINYDNDIIIEAAYKNMDRLNSDKEDESGQIVAMENTIKQLIQEGETPQDIYEVLRQTWKDSSKEELDSFYSDVMQSLMSEGSIDGSIDISIPDSDEGEREASESELSKQASRIENIQRSIVQRELSHLKLFVKLAERGLIKEATEIEDMHHGPMEMLKIAAAPVPMSAKNYMINGLILGGGSMAAQVGVAAITKGYTAIKRKRMFNSLRERFPDLKEIPDKKYFDIYESITNATPALLQTPYILAEAIRKPFKTGTFTLSDMKTLTDIQAKKDSNDIAKDLSSAAQTVGKMSINETIEDPSMKITPEEFNEGGSSYQWNAGS